MQVGADYYILDFLFVIWCAAQNGLNLLGGVRGGARMGYLMPGCDGMGPWIGQKLFRRRRRRHRAKFR